VKIFRFVKYKASWLQKFSFIKSDLFSGYYTFIQFRYIENSSVFHSFWHWYSWIRGTRRRSWLRHCATNRKVASSIPDYVTEILHWQSFRPHYGPGVTQPVPEMSTRNNSWGKGGRCVGLTTLPLSCADCLEIWEPQPPGTLRACPGLQWDCFTLFMNNFIFVSTIVLLCSYGLLRSLVVEFSVNQQRVWVVSTGYDLVTLLHYYLSLWNFTSP
jgi:hypothetical protein